jgi:hypothetical protein
MWNSEWMVLTKMIVQVHLAVSKSEGIDEDKVEMKDAI